MKKFAVIGSPIAHSKSPVLHEAGFSEMNLEASFEQVEVSTDQLDNWISSEARNFNGVAVTIPHKEKILPLCEKLSPAAEAIGAVNTLYWDEDVLCGTNTDGLGALKAIQTSLMDLKDKQVLVLGAGGASRALVYALLMAEAKVAIWNRTGSRAVHLCDEFGADPVERLDLIDPAKIDLVCNTTSVGLKQWESVLPAEFWQVHHAAFDMVYDPLETRFLSEAGEAGARIVTGDQMLVFQALEQFRLWHGIELEPEVMQAAFFV